MCNVTEASSDLSVSNSTPSVSIRIFITCLKYILSKLQVRAHGWDVDLYELMWCNSLMFSSNSNQIASKVSYGTNLQIIVYYVQVISKAILWLCIILYETEPMQMHCSINMHCLLDLISVLFSSVTREQFIRFVVLNCFI